MKKPPQTSPAALPPLARLTLHPRPQWITGLGEDTRSLWLDGWPTTTIVIGTDLVFQMAVADGFLLFTEYDWWSGCSAWLHLLDHRGRCLDRITFEDVRDAAVRSIQPINNSTVEFKTHDAPQVWRLEVGSGDYAFAWLDLVRRCNRYLWRKRRLRLTRVPTQREGNEG
jgi:hypothetical protein